jgi:hypothetical protein
MTGELLPSTEQASSENEVTVEGESVGPSRGTISSEKVTEWLVAEGRDIGSQIAHLNLIGERIMGAFVALVALTATVAIANEKTYLTMGLPVLLTIVLGYVLVAQSDMVGLAACKACLEAEINRRCRIPVTQWESRVVASGHSRIQTRIAWILTALTLAIGSSAAILAALQTTKHGSWGYEHSDLYLTATTFSVGVEILVVVGLVFANHRTHGSVSALVEKSFDEPKTVSVKESDARN